MNRMKLPSLRKLSEDSLETLKRFPLTLIMAAIASISAIILVNDHNIVDEDNMVRIILSSMAGIPFLIASFDFIKVSISFSISTIALTLNLSEYFA